MKKTIALSISLLAAVVVTGIHQARHAAQRRGEVETLPQPLLGDQTGAIVQALEPATNQVAAVSAKRQPAAPMQAVSTNAAVTGLFRSSNLYAFLTNKTAKLKAEQVEPYLNANRRDAASLLAAFRTTGDPALLTEAAKKYPNDPQVGFEAAIRMDASPEERRQALEAFKQAAPENALADYLSALAHLKAGEPEQAVRDLVAAAGKPQVQDYQKDRVQTDEEAYLAAGYPVAEAKVAANFFLTQPQLVQVKELGQSLLGLAKTYQQAGDEASGQAALQMAVNLGRRYEDPSVGQTLMSQLVGVNVERTALGTMDPNSPYGDNGQTVQNRLDELAQQKQGFRDLAKQADAFWKTMSDQDWISYHTRSSVFGEESALRWLVGKYGAR